MGSLRCLPPLQRPQQGGQPGIELLAVYALTIGALACRLQFYLVQVPRQAHAALWKGAIQPVASKRWGEQFMALVNPDIYSPQHGLWREEPTFMASVKTIVEINK